MTREQLEHVIRAAAAISPETLEQRIRQLEPGRPVEPIVAWARRRAQEAQA